MTSTIHLRVPAALKKAAQKIAEANGLDLSSVIRMFLVQMKMRGTIPMKPLTINGFTEDEENEILERSKGPFIHAKNAKEFFDSIGI